MAGLKTYIPGLRLVLKTAHRFMTRWQSQLSGTLTEAQYACLVATIAAVAECLGALGEAVIEP
jgi:hypothetical protein